MVLFKRFCVQTFNRSPDVKPGNVFVDNDNVITVGDFGLLSRDYSSDETGIATTGTIAYLSPERLTLEKVDNLNAEEYAFITRIIKKGVSTTSSGLIGPKVYGQAGDIWSVGIIALEAMAGRHPFYKNDENIELRELTSRITETKINVQDFVKNKGYSPELVDFVTKCLDAGMNEGKPTRWGYDEISQHPIMLRKGLDGSANWKERYAIVGPLTKGLKSLQ